MGSLDGNMKERREGGLPCDHVVEGSDLEESEMDRERIQKEGLMKRVSMESRG